MFDAFFFSPSSLPSKAQWSDRFLFRYRITLRGHSDAMLNQSLFYLYPAFNPTVTERLTKTTVNKKKHSKINNDVNQNGIRAAFKAFLTECFTICLKMKREQIEIFLRREFHNCGAITE